MENKRWTFASLAQANGAILEQILLNSIAPDPEKLAGYVYDGYNHDWLGRLPGEKFKKAFQVKAGSYYGLNQVVVQDGRGFTGQWANRLENGKPVEHGFFSMYPASESPLNRQTTRYNQLLVFNYNIDLNPRSNFMMRAIRDYVGLPNEEDYELVLGKAYLQVASFLNIFASYFILGNRSVFRPSDKQ